MASGVPTDPRHAERLLRALAKSSKLDMTPSDRKSSFELEGHVDGQPVRTTVAIRESMGAVYFRAQSRLPIEPSLGLGLDLQRVQTDNRIHGRTHLPKAWRQSIVRAFAGTPLYRVSSVDPCPTRALLDSVPPLFEEVELSRLTDELLETHDNQLGARSELEAHLHRSARWARQLAEASETFAPRDHDALPAAAWTGPLRRREGTIDFRRAAANALTPGAALSLRAAHESDRYTLHGHLRFDDPYPSTSSASPAAVADCG